MSKERSQQLYDQFREGIIRFGTMSQIKPCLKFLKAFIGIADQYQKWRLDIVVRDLLKTFVSRDPPQKVLLDALATLGNKESTLRSYLQSTKDEINDYLARVGWRMCM